jgi:hypothetical protein
MVDENSSEKLLGGWTITGPVPPNVYLFLIGSIELLG